MRENFNLLILLAGAFAFPAAQAANPEAGKAAAAVCVACHGANGVSATGMYPNLAGQKEEYLNAQLKAFRDKTRQSPIMNSQTASLKDEDIANLAAYFAGLKPCQ